MDEMTLSNTLIQWIDIATEDLCVTAAERIAAEIREHYEDALQDALREGLTPVEADLRAVALLGNPQRAARAFRRQHFTDSQARLIRRVMGFDAKHAKRIVIAILFLLLALMLWGAYVFTPWFATFLTMVIGGGVWNGLVFTLNNLDSSIPRGASYW